MFPGVSYVLKIFKWNMINNETSPLMKLPEDVFPTDMHWFPKSAQGGKKAPGSDVFALGSSDGGHTFNHWFSMKSNAMLISRQVHFDISIWAH